MLKRMAEIRKDLPEHIELERGLGVPRRTSLAATREDRGLEVRRERGKALAERPQRGADHCGGKHRRGSKQRQHRDEGEQHRAQQYEDQIIHEGALLSGSKTCTR